MESTVSMEFDLLLAPISGDSPVGSDLRKDLSPTSIYYKIKDARNLARTLERHIRQGEPVGENPAVHWQEVINLSSSILSSKSKDLEVCAWYIEALLRQQQFQGLANGFSLTRQLCEQYWDIIYPLADEDGLITKTAALVGLNGEDSEGTLIAPISNVPITQGKTAGPFALWQYQQAKDVSQISDLEKRNKRLASGAVNLSEFEKAVNETSSTFFMTLIVDLQNCLTEFEKLTTFLDNKCGKESPPSTQIREALTNCLSSIKFISKNIVIEDTSNLSQNSITPDNATVADGKEIKHREDAFNILSKIADYFLSVEPHSPLSYLIKKTIRWGKLPLPELLKELIPDEHMRNETFLLTGIVEEQKSE